MQRAGSNITPETIRNSLPAMMPGMPDGVVDFKVGMTDASIRLGGGSLKHEGLYEDYAVPNLAVHHATKEHGIPVTSGAPWATPTRPSPRK